VNDDRIILRLPPDPDYRRVALLVVGGLGVRLNLTLERLEDLQIAVQSLLGRTVPGENVTLELRIGRGAVSASVSPVEGDALREELAAGDGNGGVSLRRVLDAVADGFELVERDGVQWLAVEKRVEAEAADGE
jgi:hypothetical protein